MITGILLAAGQSRRFGSDKLLHPLADGQPMVTVCARKLRAVCSECVAVLRPDQTTLASLLEAEGVQCSFSALTAHGMGHSLASAVAKTPGATGWLVALGDMPFIGNATLARVAEALRTGASLVAPFYHGQRGHPVGFARSWYQELSRLEGDQGARSILARAPVVQIDCDDPGVLVDIDTPMALARVAAGAGLISPEK